MQGLARPCGLCAAVVVCRRCILYNAPRRGRRGPRRARARRRHYSIFRIPPSPGSRAAGGET